MATNNPYMGLNFDEPMNMYQPAGVSGGTTPSDPDSNPDERMGETPNGDGSDERMQSNDMIAEVFFEDFLTDVAEEESFMRGMGLVPGLEQRHGNDDAGSSEMSKLSVAPPPPGAPSAPKDDVANGDIPDPKKKRKKRADVQARRRELNRNNAKKSRLRQKFKVESLVLRVGELEEENKALRALCKSHAGAEGDTIPPTASGEALATGAALNPSAKVLRKSDFSLIESITKAASNFCITDPHQADNPIVFASPGFFNMSGYNASEVMGRNCRFLQGPETNQETVTRIRSSFTTPGDIAATVLNYRKDGTPFWNQLFIAPLMAADGKTVIHYVGVQREVTVNSIPFSVLARISDGARADKGGPDELSEEILDDDE